MGCNCTRHSGEKPMESLVGLTNAFCQPKRGPGLECVGTWSGTMPTSLHDLILRSFDSGVPRTTTKPDDRITGHSPGTRMQGRDVFHGAWTVTASL